VSIVRDRREDGGRRARRGWKDALFPTNSLWERKAFDTRRIAGDAVRFSGRAQRKRSGELEWPNGWDSLSSQFSWA
jgi:hypothetical protein